MVAAKDLIVFDMDGVLVDVTESYRAAIEQTVQHFTGKPVSNDTIQEYKNRGGFNDDWVLSHRLIQERGVELPFQQVVDHFQSIFIGVPEGGLIRKERWLASPGLLERLAESAVLAVFTGRMKWEAYLTLDRFAPGLFTDVVGVDNVAEPKPSPEGLLKLTAAHPHARAWYVGDSIDDARAGQQAKVSFIGIAAPSSPRRDQLISVLQSHGALAIIEDINQLETIVNYDR